MIRKMNIQILLAVALSVLSRTAYSSNEEYGPERLDNVHPGYAVSRTTYRRRLSNRPKSHVVVLEPLTTSTINTLKRRLTSSRRCLGKDEKFSAGDRVFVQLPGIPRTQEGIVKERTATGYIVEFYSKRGLKLGDVDVAPEKLTSVHRAVPVDALIHKDKTDGPELKKGNKKITDPTHKDKANGPELKKGKKKITDPTHKDKANGPELKKGKKKIKNEELVKECEKLVKEGNAEKVPTNGKSTFKIGDYEVDMSDKAVVAVVANAKDVFVKLGDTLIKMQTETYNCFLEANKENNRSELAKLKIGYKYKLDYFSKRAEDRQAERDDYAMCLREHPGQEHLCKPLEPVQAVPDCVGCHGEKEVPRFGSRRYFGMTECTLCNGSGKQVVCPTCSGIGRVPYSGIKGWLSSITGWKDLCPTCSGGQYLGKYTPPIVDRKSRWD